MNALLIAVVVAAVAASPMQAPQWSAEQSEVWAAVEAMWNDYSSENLEAAFAAHHPDFIFWNNTNSVPGTKEMADELDTFWFESGAMLRTSVTPLTIQVFDDFAIVNAYVRGFAQEFGGAPQWMTWRWHSGWAKEGDEWLCVSNFIYWEQGGQ